jgi:ferritin-like metal-binding protein YciE
MEMETLRDLYIDELKDLWSAEKQLVAALPRMAKAANDPQLAKAFNTHLRETERQVKRLEQVFKSLGVSPRGKKCVGMEALIEEGKELIKEKPEPSVLDAGLIAKAQHVEHYEIAGYGTVRTYAQLLGEQDQARLLQQTLDEEGNTDKILTELAERSINVEAMTADADEEEEEATTSRSRSRSSAKRGATRTDREVSRSASVESSTRREGGRRPATSRPTAEESEEDEATM